MVLLEDNEAKDTIIRITKVAVSDKVLLMRSLVTYLFCKGCKVGCLRIEHIYDELYSPISLIIKKPLSTNFHGL